MWVHGASSKNRQAFLVPSDKWNESVIVPIPTTAGPSDQVLQSQQLPVQIPVQRLVERVSDAVKHGCLNGTTFGPQVDSGGLQLSTIFGARWAEHNLSNCLQRIEGTFWNSVFPGLTSKTPIVYWSTWQGAMERTSKTPKCLEMHGIIS